MEKRQSVIVRVFDGEQYDADWPTPGYPSLLVDAINWFKTKLADIPKEYRATATCKIDSKSGYEGSYYAHIEISYERPETDQEMADRLAQQQARENEVKEREMATLRTLQAKYRQPQ